MIDLGPNEVAVIWQGETWRLRYLSYWIPSDRGEPRIERFWFVEDDAPEPTPEDWLDLEKLCRDDCVRRARLWRGELGMRHIRKRGVPLSDDVGAA